MSDSDSFIIREELKKTGIHINDIYDLVNTKSKYPEAIPVLLKLLSEVSNYKLKEGIIRSLAVKEAKGLAGPSLLKEYFAIPIEKDMLRWAIGNTMEVVATEKELDEIIEIVTNTDNGTSRQMFVSALGKFKNERINSVLIKLLDDDDVRLHAIKTLGKLKVKNAIGKLSALEKNTDKVIQREASKALKRITK